MEGAVESIVAVQRVRERIRSLRQARQALARQREALLAGRHARARTHHRFARFLASSVAPRVTGNGTGPTSTNGAPPQIKVARTSVTGGKDVLTKRQLEILSMVAQGKADKEIALELKLSKFTVQTHLRHILENMGASSRTDASVRALRDGLIG